MKQNTGNIILLNGSSSAGKTTLAHKLQQLLPEPYQHIALDQFRDGLPDSHRGFNSPPTSRGAAGLNVVPTEQDNELVTQIQFGNHGRQVLAGMRRAIAAFARVGNHVIIDDLLFEPEFLEDYATALQGLPTWLVGVRCDLEVVVAREALRPGRFPGTAVSHFHSVHAHGQNYDVEVNTAFASPRECALQIIARLGQPPQTLRDMVR